MRYLFVLITFFLLFSNCKDDITNIDNPPEKVNWVKKTPDDSLCVERGIDAYSEQEIENAIILEWKAVKDNDIDSYIIYTTDVDTGYGYPINFIHMTTLKIDDIGNDGFEYNSYADSSFSYFFDLNDMNLNKNTYSYFYIMAKDKGKNYSEHSDTIKYNLLDASSALDYNNNYFSWDWPNNGASSQIIFRVERQLNNWEPFYVRRIDGSESQVINEYYDDPEIYIDNLNYIFPQGYYRFRIDNSYGDEDKGSESKWQQFTRN